MISIVRACSRLDYCYEFRYFFLNTTGLGLNCDVLSYRLASYRLGFSYIASANRELNMFFQPGV